MGFSAFDERLLRTFSGYMFYLFAILIAMTIFLAINMIIYLKTKSKQVSLLTKKKPGNGLIRRPMPRKKAQKYLMKQGAVVLLLACFALYLSCTVSSDIKNQQYIMITAQYTREGENTPKTERKKLFFNSNKVSILDKGKEFSLRLPHRWRDHEFPEGTYWGTIWYSEKTKVILQFDPIEQENPVYFTQESDD